MILFSFYNLLIYVYLHGFYFHFPFYFLFSFLSYKHKKSRTKIHKKIVPALVSQIVTYDHKISKKYNTIIQLNYYSNTKFQIQFLYF